MFSSTITAVSCSFCSVRRRSFSLTSSSGAGRGTPVWTERTPEPPEIKEEQEELCSGQEGEQLVLKEEETDTFMVTPAQEGSDGSGDQTLYLNPDRNRAAESSMEPEANSDLQLLSDSSHVAESPDQKGGKHGDSGDAEMKQNTQQHENKSHDNNVYNNNNNHTAKKSVNCGICGKDFKCKSSLNVHLRVHAGEKPHLCKTCEKRFRDMSALIKHIRVHTDEKPYLCKTCGKRFIQISNLNDHLTIHTGEKKSHVTELLTSVNNVSLTQS